jgi:hypothetical protein
MTATWRKHNFEAGKRYRLLTSFQTATSEFLAGEVVAFKEADYSSYDSSTAFLFDVENEKKIKTWFLLDNEDDTSKGLFDRLD